MLLYLILVGGPTFGILYQAWKAWDFSHSWRAVQATTLSSDYSDAERRADNEPFAFFNPHPIRDGRTGRFTKVCVEYTDASGHQHNAVITESVRRGTEVKAIRRIFYDVRDPTRVNRFGAFGAWMWLVIFGLVLGNDLWRLSTIQL